MTHLKTNKYLFVTSLPHWELTYVTKAKYEKLFPSLPKEVSRTMVDGSLVATYQKFKIIFVNESEFKRLRVIWKIRETLIKEIPSEELLTLTPDTLGEYLYNRFYQDSNRGIRMSALMQKD